MSERDRSPELGKLKARLEKARGGGRPPAPRPGTGGLAEGLRLSLELAAAVAVGVGIGWFLDRWLATSPLFLLLFLALGLASGIRNVYQAANRMDAERTAGEGPAKKNDEELRTHARVEKGKHRRGRGEA